MLTAHTCWFSIIVELSGKQQEGNTIAPDKSPPGKHFKGAEKLTPEPLNCEEVRTAKVPAK